MKKFIIPVAFSLLALTVTAQKKTPSTSLDRENSTTVPSRVNKQTLINNIENNSQLLSAINGELRLGDNCLKSGIKFKASMSSSERAKVGSFTVNEAVKGKSGSYVPGKVLASVTSFGQPNGSSIPFSITKFGQQQRVFIVFNGQDRFFEGSVLSYTFTSESKEVTNSILMTAKPFFVTVSCDSKLSKKL